MPFLDPCDTIVAQLTYEGRNLLARAKFGDVAFRVAGWQMGRGGYDVTDPVKVTPFIDPAAVAVWYVKILSNSFVPGDKVVLNGVTFDYGVVWRGGSTIAATISSGALESANVDLAQEFTNMIIAQRGFQSNARVITTSDSMLDDLVNLKR